MNERNKEYKKKDVIPARLLLIIISAFRVVVLISLLENQDWEVQFAGYVVFDICVERFHRPGLFSYTLNIWHGDHIARFFQLLIISLGFCFFFRINWVGLVILHTLDIIAWWKPRFVPYQIVRSLLFQQYARPYRIF